MSSHAQTGDNHCLHCGQPLGEKTFAEHMGYGLCEETEQPDQTHPTPEYPAVPTLEDAPSTVDKDKDDLRRRRQLADRLAEAGVWTTTTTERE